MNTPNEIEHEQKLIKGGRRKLQSDLKKDAARNYYSNTQIGRRVLQEIFTIYEEELINTTDKAITGKAGRGNIIQCCKEMKSYINSLTADVIVVATLKQIIDFYSSEKGYVTVVDLAGAIGGRIESEVWFDYYQKNTDAEIASSARKRASMPGSTPKYRKYSTRKTTEAKAKKKGYKLVDKWSNEHRNRIGLYLMEVARSVGIIEWKKITIKNKNQSIIVADELMNMFMGYEELALGRAFNSHPLIDVPKQWEPSDKPARYNNSGGYHLEQLRHRQSMTLGQSTDSVFGDKAVELLNTLQATAWRIDSRILQLALRFNEDGVTVKSFKVCQKEKPSSNAPTYIAEDINKLKQWKQDTHQAHKTFIKLFKNSYRSRNVLSLAKEYEFKTFYLSWACDWRGRFYTQQSWLSILSTDFERSLLKFRDGCKLNNDSLYWCKAALGAAYNGTSISYKERVKWTEENQELITRIANEPQETSEWEVAKEPWQFLQLCLEWNDVVVTKKEKFWKVAVGADSTASGLQLLSAMRRDSVGMKYANLLEPTSDDAPPEDAYMQVLAEAKKIIEKSNDLNYLLPYLQYRSVGKPAVMLSVYGGSHGRISERIEEALLEEDIVLDAAVLSKLTTTILNASKKVFPAAYDALKWLKKLARAAHNNGMVSLTWTTPTEDKIHCIKNEIEKKKIYTAFNGYVVIGDFDSEKPDTEKEVTSFPPAFVHCYDAALLKESFTDWKLPIAVIHDCIRVLPSDMDKALDRVRDGFTSITTGDPLARLADDLGVSEEQLPRLPQLDGDLGNVLKSRYMFN